MSESVEKVVLFTPIMTASCNVEQAGRKTMVIEFPVARPEVFSPKWLIMDIEKGEPNGSPFFVLFPR